MISPVFRPGMAASKPLAMWFVVCTAWSSSAIAQTPQGKTLTPLVVTASRSPQSMADVLSDNVVITSDEIARSDPTALVDLLQKQRGIEIIRNGGPGANASVLVRGADSKQSIVLIDGVRVGSSTSGDAAWANIPLSQIDRVEIVQGPLSSLYGANAMGGVIQIFTKKGNGPVAPTIAFGAGSYGTRNIETGVSGAKNGIRYAISASHEEADGFSAKKPAASNYNPDEDGYQRDSASGQLSFEFAKDHELGIHFLRSRLDNQYDASAAYDDHLVHHLGSYAISSKNRFLPNWTSRFQLARSSDRATDESTSSSQFDTKQTQVSWQNDLSIGTADLLQLVLERRKEEVDATMAALNRERVTNSAAAAYQLKRGAHLASLSVRTDHSTQFGSHQTGNAAYGYRITPVLRANVSYGTSFRAPTFNELYFPGFGNASNQPEKGKNAEAGLHYDDGTLQFGAVYYHNRITDLIVTARPCPVTPAAYPRGCAYNVNKALLTGLSLNAGTKMGNFTLRGTLDVQDPHDEMTGKILARRAKRHGTLSVDYRAGAAQAGAELVLSGKRFDDAANLNRLGGYGLLNLYASYDVAPNWSLFGRWNNVTDKDYELAKNYATAGSNLFVGVRYGMR